MATYKFRSTTITGEQIDQIAAAKGCESRAELLRALVREEAQRQGIEFGETS